jgi:lysophospholipase L1-like esterase
MLLGDSITEGCCDGYYLGYRYYLWEELIGNGHEGHFEFVGTQHGLRNLLGNNTARSDSEQFKFAYRRYEQFMKTANNHEGRTGAMTRDVWAPIEEILFRQRPDIVVVLLGNNDLIGMGVGFIMLPILLPSRVPALFFILI